MKTATKFTDGNLRLRVTDLFARDPHSCHLGICPVEPAWPTLGESLSTNESFFHVEFKFWFVLLV